MRMSPARPITRHIISRTVSYTHLDVYKRQAWRRLHKKIDAEFDSDAIMGYNLKINADEIRVTEKVSNLLFLKVRERIDYHEN